MTPDTHHELIEECERCGGDLDANESGHYKSPSEVFVHQVCYEEGVPEEPIRDLSRQYPFEECWNRQYTCGHYAYGPPKRLPGECPECEVPAV